MKTLYQKSQEIKESMVSKINNRINELINTISDLELRLFTLNKVKSKLTYEQDNNGLMTNYYGGESLVDSCDKQFTDENELYLFTSRFFERSETRILVIQIYDKILDVSNDDNNEIEIDKSKDEDFPSILLVVSNEIESIRTKILKLHHEVDKLIHMINTILS